MPRPAAIVLIALLLALPPACSEIAAARHSGDWVATPENVRLGEGDWPGSLFGRLLSGAMDVRAELSLARKGTYELTFSFRGLGTEREQTVAGTWTVEGETVTLVSDGTGTRRTLVHQDGMLVLENESGLRIAFSRPDR